MEISILVLDKNLSQTYLGTVIELAKRNSATLGFMPEGAFYQQAIQKRILIALTPEDRCVGYLLYREVKTQRKASITHLCIDERYRQHGYARELVRKLKQITSHLRGISLYSRRDYSSNTFWPNNGFIYQGEKPGRGKDKIPLSYYWFEQPNHTDLFSWLNQKQLNTKDIKAVIDANLFFDLSGAKNPPHTEKEIIAQSLLANWLQDEILLCVTPEIYNEINRREHPQERKRNKSFADQFPKIFDSRTEGTYDSVEQQVRQNFFPQELSISDRSDLRQLTYAILGQAKFFITNDGRLVDQVGEGIFDMFGLTVIRPSDFIIHFDEIVREVDYQPARLAGTRILINKTSSGQDEVLANLFQITAHETKPQFLSSLRRYLSNPLEFQVLVVAEPNKDPVALIVYSIKAHNRVEIPLFRVRKHTLSGTIASHLVLNAISYANQNDAQLIRVTERYLEGEIVDALRAHYFVQINQQWTKISLQIFATVSEVLSYLSGLRTKYQDESEYLFESQNSLDRAFSCNETGNLFEFEKIFWPIKLLDANIPTFVVAIQPYWAMNLFDEPLGKQDIFGSKPELAFNRENVYYRSAHQKILTSPGRVLWYVTGGKGYQNIMSLRACSHLDQVTIGTPKELFRQFKRLGIYQFSDLLKITKNDLTQNIMAFRFSGTQLFARPIQWEKLKKILDRDGPIQSPLRIDQETFANIYQTAFNGEA